MLLCLVPLLLLFVHFFEYDRQSHGISGDFDVGLIGQLSGVESGGELFFVVNRTSMYEQPRGPRSDQVHLLLVHGYGEHCGRMAYQRLASMLAQTTASSPGIVVHCVDLPGHGYTAAIKTRGNLHHAEAANRAVRGILPPSFDVLVDTVRAALREIEAALPPTGTHKVILAGHSLGGLIAVHTLASYRGKVDGLLLSSPALLIDPATTPPPAITSFLRYVVAPLAPTLPVTSLSLHHLTSNVTEAQSYEQDPLVYAGGIPARTAKLVLAATEAAPAALAALPSSLPLYHFHGDDDKIASVGATDIMSRWFSGHPTILRIPRGRHELLTESGWQDIVKGIRDWIDTIQVAG
uniref:Serine aminopeptidase S33 domain-containing protein n=1 Tax=Sexangularia sp. CB-2014 TaxID=1486929 RepID=A0A7S1YMF8_9EUKA|mmetsp:Transcript_9321/g.29657  ORF Transcript_9321/g.29657 Transcript_9321/m.29657 type:complete len:350 (+) Transcript_9321:70-1119(+)